MTTRHPIRAPQQRGEVNATLDFSHLRGCDLSGVQKIAADCVSRFEAEKGARRIGRAMQTEMAKPRGGFRRAF